MRLPKLQRLEAGLIPRELFPARAWYLASPLWYYHRPSHQLARELDQRLYKLVDPKIQPLCRLLHQHGIRTTPSCQGHFYARSHFENVWHELLREKNLIRNGGLTVRDAQSGKAYLFKSSRFNLPWRNFGQFFQEMETHQGEGYLGLWLEPAWWHLLDEARRWPAPASPLRLQESGPYDAGSLRLVGFLVDARTPEELDATWQEITERLRALLEKARRFRRAS